MLLDFFFMVYANLLSPYFMLVFISAFIGTKLYRFFLIQKLRGEDMSDFKKRFVKKVEHKVDDLLSGGVGTENYGSPYGGVSDYTGEDGADDNTNNNS